MKKLQTSKPKNLINPGTIWQLGQHRLAYGDCRDKNLIGKLLTGNKINLICCDPPYGVAAVESKRNFKRLLKDKIITNDQIQSDQEYQSFSKNWLEAIRPHLSLSNSCYIFNADKMVWSDRKSVV